MKAILRLPLSIFNENTKHNHIIFIIFGYNNFVVFNFKRSNILYIVGNILIIVFIPPTSNNIKEYRWIYNHVNMHPIMSLCILDFVIVTILVLWILFMFYFHSESIYDTIFTTILVLKSNKDTVINNVCSLWDIII